MSLESRLKSAVNALEKPFKGIIPENLMPEHSKWEPDESSEDDPTPDPEPEPEKGIYVGIISGEVGKISATRGKGGSPYPVNLTIYNSSQVEVASGSFTAEDVAPLEVVDEDIVAGTYSVHIVWLGTKDGEPCWLYDDKEVVIE